MYATLALVLVSAISSGVYLLTNQSEQFDSSKSESAQLNKAQPNRNSANSARTPTEAYKMLFAAVKAKDVEKIKQLMSKNSLGLAEFSANQQKQPVEKILENGFLAPTLAASITEMRDERVKDNFGAVEVYNQKDKMWEDLPFVLEDGGWKVAVGDVFQETYKSPRKEKRRF